MPFKFVREHPTHFEAHGAKGPFKIAKQGLSPATVARYQKLAKGGEVEAPRPEDGGQVEPGPAAEPAPSPAEMIPLPVAQQAQAFPPPPRQPRMVPMPTARSGGDSILPTQILAPDEDLYIDPGSSRADPARIRAAMDAAAKGWGAPAQDWRGLEVHLGSEIPGETDHTGRTLVRRSNGAVTGGRMDVRYDGQGDVAGSSLAHEVGHLVLGGDYEHKDPRWGSRKFWRGMADTMGRELKGRPPDLEPYRVDWSGYANGGEVEGGDVYQLHHEDEDAFHIRHPDGSVVAVAKKGTPGHVLKAVKLLPKFADGGEVEPPKDAPKGDEHAAGWGVADRIHAALPEWLSARTPVHQHNEQLAAADRAAAGENAPAPKMAGGGEAPDLRPSSGLEDPAAAAAASDGVWYPTPDVRFGRLPVVEPTPPPEPVIPPEGGAPGLAWHPGPSTIPSEGDLLASAQGEPPAPDAGAAPPDAAAAAPATPGVPPALARPPEPAAATVAAGGAGASPLSFPPLPAYPSAGLERGIGEMVRTGREGAELQARAQTQQSQEMAAAYQQHLKSLTDLETKRQSDLAGVQQEINAAIDDVRNQHVDPNHFWSSKATGQKVSAMVGILLGGIGSGLTGQPNAALATVQRAIDRDVDAQRAELGKKENLLTQLYRKYGNVEEAAAATRSYLTASIAGQAGLIAARSGNLQAQATAKLLESHLQGQALGPMAQIVNGKYQADLTRYQMSWQQRLWSMFSGGASGGGDGYVPSAVAPVFTGDPKEHLKAQHEQRIDWADANGNRRWSFGKPGQAKEANEQLSELEMLRKDANELKALAKQATTGLVPWSAVRAKWDVLQGNFALAAPRALGGVNRMSDTELGIGQKTTGDTIWKTKLNDGAALDAALQLVQRRQDAILRSQGVDERYLGAGGPAVASYLTAPVR